MASFIIAHKGTQSNEGGYASAQYAASIGDSGGETYRGMSRNNTGSNPVWNYIDAWKQTNGAPAHNQYINDARINSLVDQFYKTDIWNVLKLDQVNSQGVANVLFDIGTNSGPGTAALSVQRVIGINADGSVGPVTLNAINSINSNTLINGLIAYRKQWLQQNQAGKSYLQALLDRADRYSAYLGEGANTFPILIGLGAAAFLYFRFKK